MFSIGFILVLEVGRVAGRRSGTAGGALGSNLGTIWTSLGCIAASRRNKLQNWMCEGDGIFRNSDISLLACFFICCGECVNQRSGVLDGRLTAMFDMLIVSCGLLSIALGAKDVPKYEMLIFHVLYNVSRASNNEGRSFVARLKGNVLGGIKKAKFFPRIWGLSACK